MIEMVTKIMVYGGEKPVCQSVRVPSMALVNGRPAILMCINVCKGRLFFLEG